MNTGKVNIAVTVEDDPSNTFCWYGYAEDDKIPCDGSLSPQREAVVREALQYVGRFL